MSSSISPASRNVDRDRFYPERWGRGLDGAELPDPGGDGGIPKDRHSCDPGAISLNNSSHLRSSCYSNCIKPWRCRLAAPSWRRNRRRRVNDDHEHDRHGAGRLKQRPTDEVPWARMTSGASAANSAACLRISAASVVARGCRSSRCGRWSSTLAAIPAGMPPRVSEIPRRPRPRAGAQPMRRTRSGCCARADTGPNRRTTENRDELSPPSLTSSAQSHLGGSNYHTRSELPMSPLGQTLQIVCHWAGREVRFGPKPDLISIPNPVRPCLIWQSTASFSAVMSPHTSRGCRCRRYTAGSRNGPAKRTRTAVRFELSEQTRQAVDDYLKATANGPASSCSPAVAVLTAT